MRDGRSDILLVDPTTGRRKLIARSQITSHPWHPHPVFTPDGKAIVYAEGSGDTAACICFRCSTAYESASRTRDARHARRLAFDFRTSPPSSSILALERCGGGIVPEVSHLAGVVFQVEQLAVTLAAIDGDLGVGRYVRSQVQPGRLVAVFRR